MGPFCLLFCGYRGGGAWFANGIEVRHAIEIFYMMIVKPAILQYIHC
jgi:hypothetical protein